MVSEKQQVVGRGKEDTKMARKEYAKMDRELTVAIKQYLLDPRRFTHDEIARLTGVSTTTVSRVNTGEYDHLLDPSSVGDSEISGNITQIPYEELKNLIKCEQFIAELFAMAVASDKDDDELYFPRHYINATLKRYFPDTYTAKLEAVKADTYA